MNIAIISTFDIRGGAARAAYRLHKGLRSLGNDSVILVKEKKTDDPHVLKVIFRSNEYRTEEKLFLFMQDRCIIKNRTELSNTFFSLPYPGYELSETQIIKASDIINLHWVANFQSVETIASLLELGKPVVWTLHDQWAFTGGCHYTAGCEKYNSGCIDCPQLFDNDFQIPRLVLQNKLNSLISKNLTVATPSKWLGECAKNSSVFRNTRIEVIPNSLEIDVFRPVRKDRAKKKFGLKPQTVTLLFGAESHKERRKGFRQLLKTMNFCMKNEKFRSMISKGKIRVLTFGTPTKEVENMGISVKPLGYIRGDNKLANVYSAADLYILPSLEDNLPNNMLESMSCGTPVVGFQAGGIPDLIQDDYTGYLAPFCNEKKMAEKILKLVFDENIRRRMSQNCRSLIKKKFALDVQANNYQELFVDLLAEKNFVPSQSKYNFDQKEISIEKWDVNINPLFFPIFRKYSIEMIKVLIDNNEKGRFKHFFNRLKFFGRKIYRKIRSR